MKGTKNTTNLRISDLKKDYESNILKSNSDYQRYNNAWGLQQKGSLIISILENYPIGEIIRRKISDDGISEYFEIVDGLQRLTAISEFVNDGFSLNTENSIKIIKNYLAHFELSEEKDIKKIVDKYKKNENIRLKFKNLPTSLKNKIQTAEVSVSTLINWEYIDVIEYFRRVQEGKPLTNADKLHTIQAQLTSNIKSLSNNNYILNCLGLKHENGNMRKGADRIIYQTALEAIYCKMGQTIGQPKKLFIYFKDKEYNTEQEGYSNIISNFLTNLTDTDKSLLNPKSLTTDLKLTFCLLLFGNDTFKNYEIKDCIKYIISVSTLTGYLKNLADKNTTENRIKFYDKLNEYNLTSAYEENKEWFENFTRFRAGSHSHSLVENICNNIAKAYKYTLVEEIV